MVKRGRGPRGGPRGGGADLQKDLQLLQSDPRFAHVASDPKYRHIPKKERKIKLDSRFHSILTDEKFYEKSTMDPRGRKGNYSTKEDLLRFYHLSSDEGSDDAEEKEEEEEEEDEEKEEEEEEEAEDEEEEDEDEEKEEDEDSGEESNGNLYISIDGEGKKDGGVKEGRTSEEESEKTKEDKEKKTKKEKGKKKGISKKETKEEKDENNDKEQEEEDSSHKKERSEVTEEVRSRLQDLTRDYARGGGDLYSDDSSDDDSTTTDEDEDEDLDEFEWAELDQDAVWDNEVDVEETNRIAICNLDWDRIKAADLMVLFSSFCPLGGSVRSVTIYPSEYGKKRMEEEDRSGPLELTGRKKKKGEEEEEVDEEAEEYFRSLNLKDLDKLEKGKLDQHSGATKRDFEALRRYQRNRLRYFYAVMECDSVDTARGLYMECDRQPFEGAGILLDMRYVPSDMEFDETPHDLCRAVPQSYRAKSFVTTALQSTRPALTWDETDPDRSKTLSTAMAQALKGGTVGDGELRDFLASSSEEEDDEEKEEEEEEEEDTSDSDGNEEVKSARIAKFRALIQEIDEKEKRRKDKQIDMEEILDEKEEEEEEEEEEENKKVTQLNPFEKYLEKRNAKKKEKRKKQKKKKKGEEEEEEEDEDAISDDDLPDGADDLYSDPFFADELKKRDKKKKKKIGKEEEEEEEEDTNDKGNLELLLMEEEEEDKRHFNMREIIKSSEEDTSRKKRRKKNLKKKMKEKQEEQKKKVDDFKVNLSDTRFTELLTAGEYNIDPSHPQFKRTKAMDGLISEIQKKRRLESGEEVPGAKKPHLEEETKRHLELASLVQRVKRKTGKGKRAAKRSDPDT
ncbi:ESF1 homolog isoform X3 [Eriocheir sinensis]|uniref:ESF1 homolog isoform X3 n=1 Tax=Eriocheir sinensis TaxID=95602 RepID=UPI0021CA846A|nr:ESF1 homolog isoform X3 [Eriocheir sinensis]